MSHGIPGKGGGGLGDCRYGALLLAMRAVLLRGWKRIHGGWGYGKAGRQSCGNVTLKLFHSSTMTFARWRETHPFGRLMS